MVDLGNELLKELRQSIKPDDLPNEDLRWIAARCGVDTALALICNYPGMILYIPKSAERHLRQLYFEKHYNGRNLKELSQKLGLSKTTVYRWLKHRRARTTPANQLNLFDQTH